MYVVVVESPSKAKTINKYLGADYTVLASYGHVRDLPSKDGSVRPDDDFAMDWEVAPQSKKHLKEIQTALKGAKSLFLATDPDREGEAIAWHVREEMEKKNMLNGVDVKRVVFNEITKSAIIEAFNHPRELDNELIDAYMARRALDYLVGFTLSPVLWRKLPGSRSAGRVQSVALRLISERETEIEKFNPVEYWSIGASFDTGSGVMISTSLTQLDGKKLGKMDLTNEKEAKRAETIIKNEKFSVAKVEKKKSRRNPSPPFTTSTLQQEAARKLYFSARKTMQVAQRLYEGVNIGGETVGLITYMRTDGVTMAGEAITACRTLISEQYGEAYLPDAPREYKTKSKNAQEAHEAIRPTDVARRPKDVAQHLDEDQQKLYDLIWKRTLASQMESVVLDQVAIDVASAEMQTVLRATGSIIAFDGFYKLYHEGKDDAENESGDEEERILPDVKQGAAMKLGEVNPDQHFTQPPPRYSEASLVKKLEELGIGRPSTYASIISVLQDRNYVRIETRRFIPEDRGRLVIAFLSSFFERYVEYNFTADLEEKLDGIAEGNIKWKSVLEEFWRAFIGSVEGIKELRVRDVLDNLNEVLGPHFFPQKEEGVDPRSCPKCKTGELSLKLGRFGAFIGCSDYPECTYTRQLAADGGAAEGSIEAELDAGPIELGQDPETGIDVTMRKGPYGVYVQLGEQEEGSKKKPKRASLNKGQDLKEVDLEFAMGLLALPRDVGLHPEDGTMIEAGIGRFGPFIKWAGMFVSLKDDDPLEIGINRAVAIIADSGKKPPRALGMFPGSKKPIAIKTGRWGPFVSLGKIRVNVPKDEDGETITLERAVELLEARAAKDSKVILPKPKVKAKTKAKAKTKKKAAKKKAKTKTKKKAPTPKKTDSETSAVPATDSSD
ncbi:MAG: type I DNA topoisomerase [Rhodospirillaceae bacterium]|nr:type I DNA topoisomerase [Rhodospirillaceae bacterium]